MFQHRLEIMMDRRLKLVRLGRSGCGLVPEKVVAFPNDSRVQELFYAFE